MEKLWLDKYPEGVPYTINTQGTTLNNMFDEICNRYPNNRAITCDDETFTFKQIQTYVNNLANSLQQLGIKKGDRVAIVVPNIAQYPISVFAILQIGAIVVNINPLYTDFEIDYLLENSGAKTVIILDMMANKLNNLYAKHKLKNVIVTKVGDLYPFIKRNIFKFAIKYIKKSNVSYTYNALDFRELVIKNAKPIKVDVNQEDIAFIQYTGATTGLPKGAVLLHKSVVSNVYQITAWLKPQIPSLNKHVVICALPLYHIFSLTANLFTFFLNGSENIMVPNPRDVKSLVAILKKYPFTVFNALDTLYNHLLNDDEFLNMKFPYFKYSVAGGMPIREVVAKKWFELTNVMPSNCYGLSEASPAVTMSMANNEFTGSIGYPISSTEVEIRDINTGKKLPPKEIGSLWIRGPQLMREYWNNPKQTADVMDSDGWFNTRDLCYINDDGQLFLTGRQSELIIVSGFNVYPVEVEHAFDDLPGIKEVAVIGVKDDLTGEQVVAYIVVKDGYNLTEAQVREHCQKKLARYKIPKHIYFEQELPKTLVGKIDKNELKKHHQ